MKLSGTGLFFVGRSLITGSISLLVIDLVILLLLRDSLLVGCMFLENCPLHLGYPICWCTIVHSTLFL